MNECASAIQLKGTGHIGRFLQILKLPDDIQHLVDWGAGNGFIGFTSAVNIAKLKSTKDQRSLAQRVISSDINSKEIRQIVQLRERSKRNIEACVKEVIGMRPIIEKRFVFIGTVEPDISLILDRVTQKKRDEVLALAIRKTGLQGATGRLGKQVFTLAGTDDLGASMRKIGEEHIEALMRTHISEAL